MKKIVDRLSTFTGLIVGRVYLIEDDDGLTIIDASLRSAPKKILRQLASIGRAPTDVRRIAITHAHPDHIGGLPELKEAMGAEVIASSQEKPVIEGTIPIPGPPLETISPTIRPLLPGPMTMPGTPVDRIVADGDMIPAMDGLQVVATPGHAPGHLAFWQPERRILFCGDTMMHLLGMRLPFSFFTVDMAENIRSIEKLIALEPEIVCFGHGKPLVRDATGVLRKFLERVVQ